MWREGNEFSYFNWETLSLQKLLSNNFSLKFATNFHEIKSSTYYLQETLGVPNWFSESIRFIDVSWCLVDFIFKLKFENYRQSQNVGRGRRNVLWNVNEICMYIGRELVIKRDGVAHTHKLSPVNEWGTSRMDIQDMLLKINYSSSVCNDFNLLVFFCTKIFRFPNRSCQIKFLAFPILLR